MRNTAGRLAIIGAIAVAFCVIWTVGQMMGVQIRGDSAEPWPASPGEYRGPTVEQVIEIDRGRGLWTPPGSVE